MAGVPRAAGWGQGTGGAGEGTSPSPSLSLSVLSHKTGVILGVSQAPRGTWVKAGVGSSRNGTTALGMDPAAQPHQALTQRCPQTQGRR